MSQLLIHIGFPKAGSTYLQQWFSKNPDTLYAPKAIAGFYNAHDIARYAMKTEKVHDWFVLSSEDLSVWKGDVDIVGFKGKSYDIPKYQEQLCETLHGIFPSAKILIVTRGFEAMFRSLYSQYIRGGGILTFRELQEEYGNHFSMLYDYSSVIQHYRGSYGTENVIVLPFELLRTSPEKFITALEQKMQFKNHFEFAGERINPSLNLKEIAACRNISKFIFRMVSPLPSTLRYSIYHSYIKYLGSKGKHAWLEFLTKFIREEEKLVVLDSLIQSMRGKADILKGEESFQPYLKEYLL